MITLSASPATGRERAPSASLQHSPRAEGRPLPFNMPPRETRHVSHGVAEHGRVGFISSQAPHKPDGFVRIPACQGEDRKDISLYLNLDQHLAHPLALDLFEHRECHLASSTKFPVSHPARLSSLDRHSAGRLAYTLTGARPLSFHSRKSSVSRAPDVQQNTGRTPNAGQVTPLPGYVTPKQF